MEIRASVSCAGADRCGDGGTDSGATAALTVYDMCKAVQKDIVISDIRLLSKAGGVHGDFQREESK